VERDRVKATVHDTETDELLAEITVLISEYQSGWEGAFTVVVEHISLSSGLISLKLADGRSAEAVIKRVSGLRGPGRTGTLLGSGRLA
jgi:hypothetical protein